MSKIPVFKRWACAAAMVLIAGFWAGVYGAGEYRPSFEDFRWFTEEVKDTGIPLDAQFIDGYEDVLGEWKCMIVTDIESFPRDGVAAFCSMTIEGAYDDGQLVFDWYQRVFLPDYDVYDESGDEMSIFNGSATGEGLYFIGPGNVLLTDFYALDGNEYGLGKFTYPSGEIGRIALVRSFDQAEPEYDEWEASYAEEGPDAAPEDGQANVGLGSVIANIFTNIIQNTEVNTDIDQEINISQDNTVNQEININQENTINQQNTIQQQTTNVEMNFATTVAQFFVSFCDEYYDGLLPFLSEFFSVNVQGWNLFPQTDVFAEDPTDIYTKYGSVAFAFREFALENDDTPYALLVTGDVDFDRFPVGAPGVPDAVITERGIFYPVTTGSRYIMEVYSSFEEAAAEEYESSYHVTALTPPPMPEAELTSEVLRITLPDASFAMKNRLTDGYRLTIISSDGKTSQMFFKPSAAGQVKEIELAGLVEEITDDTMLMISVCEFIEDDDYTRYFGPESYDGINEENDTAEETALLDERLEEVGAESGDITISMIWNTEDDLDLHLATPEGEIWYSNKTTEHGELDVDMQTSSNMVEHPIENIYVNDPPRGEYKLRVVNYADRTEGYDTEVTVRVTINGQQNVYNFKINEDVDVMTFTY